MRGWGLLFLCFVFVSEAMGASLRLKAVTSCSQRMRDACAYIYNQPQGVMGRNPDGTVEINPLTKKKDFSNADAYLFEIAKIDETNLNNKIRPVFAQLKGLLQEKIEALPAFSPFRSELLEKVKTLGLSVDDRERCRRENASPFAAGFDGTRNVITLCPLITHMPVEELLTTFAHELGHTVDLCELNSISHAQLDEPSACGNFTTGLLQGLSYQALHCCTIQERSPWLPPLAPGERNKTCDRDNETFADYISAQITGDYILRYSRAKRGSVMYSADITKRTLGYAYIRLNAACAPDSLYIRYSTPFLQSAFVENFLSCSGVETTHVCTQSDFSF